MKDCDTMSEFARLVIGDPTCPGEGGRALALWVERSMKDPAPRLTIVAAAELVVAAGLAIFGLWPVDMHLPLHRLGIMDPLCGGTRGVAATMRGDLAQAWWYNPVSPLVIAGGFLLVARWVAGRLTGLWASARLRLTPLVTAVLGLFVVALEINQQLHVDRLR